MILCLEFEYVHLDFKAVWKRGARECLKGVLISSHTFKSVSKIVCGKKRIEKKDARTNLYSVKALWIIFKNQIAFQFLISLL